VSFCVRKTTATEGPEATRGAKKLLGQYSQAFRGIFDISPQPRAK
jgi:hypothetical protein